MRRPGETGSPLLRCIIPVYGAPLIPLENPVKGYADLPPTVEGVDVVMAVDAACGNLTLHPGVGHTVGPDRRRQRVGPRGVDREDRLTGALRVRERMPFADRDRDCANHRPTNIGQLSGFRGVLLRAALFAGAASVRSVLLYSLCF